MTDSLKATDEMGAAGATAPRISLEDIESRITSKCWFVAGDAVDGGIVSGLDLTKPHPLDRLTICVLVMDNGFAVVGKSAPLSAENFDAEKGRTFAYEDAVRQLWPLMAFSLLNDAMNGWAEF